MFAFRLFSEGGDFSCEEIKFFNQCLQKESKQIDSFESSIKTDMEKIKSSCLEQVCRITLFQMMFPIDIFDVICSQPASRAELWLCSVWQLHDGKK